MDLVDHLFVPKEDVMKEIQGLGVMSDFEPSKKYVEGAPESLLFVVDKTSKYGEVFLLCYTEASVEEFMKGIREAQEAIDAQKRAEEEAEAARIAAEWARANVVYEDKPIEPKPWISETSADTITEIETSKEVSFREPISYEVIRSKSSIKQKFRILDRGSEVGGQCEFRATKDPNFKSIRDNEIGIQSAPFCTEAAAQTTWYRSVNKAIQYEAAVGTDLEGDNKSLLLVFLEKVAPLVENSLQQNESVDIFHEAFHIVGEDEGLEGAQADNELREIKNFADPNYSKNKALVAIDWLPKANGMLAVSAVRNISFDQRVLISGQTLMSYILLWDFRQLVKPAALMQFQQEILTFRFNNTTPHLVAGGCITGQVVLWDISSAIKRKPTNKSGKKVDDEDEEKEGLEIFNPKFISDIVFCHKKGVADLVWLPPNTQINYRGQLVKEEHLDGKSYQFMTIAGDGVVMIWDIRYEKIAADELRHIGRPKHVPTEKVQGKEGSILKPLWAPIYKAPLKRIEGIGEMSLSKLACSGHLKQNIAMSTTLPGDFRSHVMLSTEEGDICFSDICATKAAVKETHEDEEGGNAETDEGRDYIKWMSSDHPRPATGFQQSPFFSDILLSVGDWSFNIWKIGESKPIFTSSLSHTYITGGQWSPTRPAVIFLSCADGHILVWDFTDTSFKHSIELHATHAKITSMEFLNSNTNNKQQLVAVGDELGTLHVFELPRNLIKPIHREDVLMTTFLDREKQCLDGRSSNAPVEESSNPFGDEDNVGASEQPMLDANGDIIDVESIKAKEKLEALKKEDDLFLKMESEFITELGLTPDELPLFAKTTRPVSADYNKSSKK